MATVERTVQFFRTDVGSTGDGRPRPFDPTPALTKLESLPFADAPYGRYKSDGVGSVLCLFVTKDQWDRVQFSRIRRTQLPLVEEEGRLSELSLPANAGLSEAIQVMFFPHNIAGAVYNHFGPRISRLGRYLREISDNAIPPVVFRPLLNDDASRAIDNLSDLRVLDFDIRPSYKNVVADADKSLAQAFCATEELLGSPKTISLVVKSDPQNARTLLPKLQGALRRILQRPDLHENVQRLRVTGRGMDTGRVGTVNLLSDHLISKQQIERVSDRNRSLDGRSAFRAISDAYADLREDLESAASVSSP